MNPIDLLPLLLIVVIVGGALFYIVSQKKKGTKCIGCPYHDGCSFKSRNCACVSAKSKKGNNGLQNDK